MAPKEEKPLMLVALIFTVWFMNNLAINFYNKHALPLEPTPPQTATESVCGLRILLVVPWGFRLRSWGWL